MFNFIDHLEFYSSALLCPGSYYAVKAALYVVVAELIILEETYKASVSFIIW
jgi:hypothetical protein